MYDLRTLREANARLVEQTNFGKHGIAYYEEWERQLMIPKDRNDAKHWNGFVNNHGYTEKA